MGGETRQAANPAGRGAGCQAVHFADAARRLGAAARAHGLTVPAFRCPPRAPGVVRSVRRYPGGAVVSVVLRERPFEEVVSDMVEGVLVVNRLAGDDASPVRTTLRAAVRLPSAEVRVVERQTRAA